MSPTKFSNVKSKVIRNTKVATKVEHQKKVDFISKIGSISNLRSTQYLNALLDDSRVRSPLGRPQTTKSTRFNATKSVTEAKKTPKAAALTQTIETVFQSQNSGWSKSIK